MRKIQASAWLLTPVTRNKTEYRSRDYDDTIFHRTNTRKRHFGEDPNACPDNTSHSPESRKRREGQRRAERSRLLYYRGRGGGGGDDGNDVSLLWGDRVRHNDQCQVEREKERRWMGRRVGSILAGLWENGPPEDRQDRLRPRWL